MQKVLLKEIYKEILSLVSDGRSIDALRLIDEQISSGRFVSQLISIKKNILKELDGDTISKIKSSQNSPITESDSNIGQGFDSSTESHDSFYETVSFLQSSLNFDNEEYLIDGYQINFDEGNTADTHLGKFNYDNRYTIIKEIVEKLKIEKLNAEKIKKTESVFKKLDLEKEINIDDEDLEPILDNEEYIQEIQVEDNDEPIDSDWFSEGFLELYDETETAPEQHLNEDDSIVEVISSEQRAIQVATELIYEFGLPNELLPVFTHIFDKKSYGPTKSLIIRGISEGYSIKEILLARDVISFWKSQDRFASKFSRLSYNSISYTKFNAISFHDAIHIINSFGLIPDIEEVMHFLELEFESWYQSQKNILNYRSFYSYLFKNRLNIDKHFVDFRDERFYKETVGYDELSNPKYLNQKCKEVEFLNSIGLLTFNNNFKNERYRPEIEYNKDTLWS